ncbi:MAG: branched-chain amino acid ABC transporter ATP-binding protein/permease [Hyphomicrobiales bacterium]|nr:MAG: branched-chain amino acid ABC transporter ATP-binding protein/permease [Hyphomicrobiales bacterium]
MTPRLQFWLVLVLGIAGLYLFREMGPTNYAIGVLTRCLILAIVAIGLNILIGQAGLVSLGQAAIYGVGSYFAAWLALRAGFGFIPAVASGIVAASLVGAALAYPSVRVRGVYLAVITIAFGLIFQNVLIEWVPVTGGTLGLTGIPRGEAFGVRLTRQIYFWVAAGCLVFAFILQYNLTYSRYGRAMRATAQSANAASALGINVANTRMFAFVVSAALAGLAGGLYTFLNLFVNFETFTFFQSISFLLMVIFGGVGTLTGPLVGAGILTYVPELFQEFKEWQTFAYGAMLAIVMFVMPAGIVGSLGTLADRLTSKARSRQSGAWPAADALPKDTTKPSATGSLVADVKGYTIVFGGLTAVSQASMRVEAGKVHGLIGPNGAGKSSLLNLMSGFYTPTAGSMSLLGQDTTGWKAHDLARAGLARTFQNTELFGDMTVLENVLVGFHGHYKTTLIETLLRLPRFGREEKAMAAEAASLLALVGLSDYSDELAKNLPFGHQRRLEIARALATRPKLILLDEPAAGLTHGEIEQLKVLIRLLTERGVAVVLVEHHVDMVMSLSNEVTVLDYGEVIASGPAAQVQDDPRVMEAYFGSGAALEDMRKLAETAGAVA